MGSIKHTMLKDHDELNDLLNKAIDGFGMARNDQKELFYFFVDKLEHHFMIEEQAIFSFFSFGCRRNAKDNP
jgi:hemerythrin-like domain-containing protein